MVRHFGPTLVALAFANVLLGVTDAHASHSYFGCFNCHVPHNAGIEGDADASWGVPLWSTRQTSDGLPTFQLYTSPTFDALNTDIGQPDGASKLCLGCHDGSYSGFHNEGDHTAETFEGDDLVRSHPISFTYDTALADRHPNGSLRDPATADAGLGTGATIAQALLDAKGKMQCTSCHDVHDSAVSTHYELRWAYNKFNDGIERTMCRVCHDK